LVRDERLAIEPAELIIDGRSVPVRLRRNAKARRIILRLDSSASGITITMPRRVTRGSALRFAAGQSEWIGRQLGRAIPAVPFAAGSTVPVRGEMHVIRQAPRQADLIERQAASPDGPAVLSVRGSEAHLARRLQEWLQSEARRDLWAACRRHAAALGVEFRKLSIRDPASRWGSCSASGALSFSWRLILAPREVLEYVAVHEVAHLVEMNHGPRFWSLVDRNFSGRRQARLWLRRHGPHLHRYGRR
jgi:predicted metal-dependent hydrolase